MKLTVDEKSANYACTVVKLPPKQAVVGLDKLVKITVFGNDVLTQKDASEEVLYLFFPAECTISREYLYHNNEFRENISNKDRTKNGYFDENGRVKAIKFKGVISTGYLAPIDTLLALVDIKAFKEGDEFTHINGNEICKKYVVKHIHASTPNNESKANKKLKRYSKLVANQFRFHDSTSHLAKNLHQFQPDDIIAITDKWHGTSIIVANVLVKKELTLIEKFLKWTGIDILTTRYDRLYSSRNVIQNDEINSEKRNPYYQEGKEPYCSVNKELEGKVEIGISLYGEVVGYMPSGKHIQKGYSYGCNLKNIPELPKDRETLSTESIVVKNEHKFLIYRITYTKPDGNVIELTWSQIKNYCKKYELQHVPELFYGTNFVFGRKYTPEEWLSHLQEKYLEKDCPYNPKGTPAEGIVVRIDGKDTFSAFKLKSRRFLLAESKTLDNQEEDLEFQN